MLHTNHVKRAEIGGPRVEFSEVDGSLISFPFGSEQLGVFEKIAKFCIKNETYYGLKKYTLHHCAEQSLVKWNTCLSEDSWELCGSKLFAIFQRT